MSTASPTAEFLPASAAGRRLVPEIMDDPGLDPALHEAALRGLGRINRVSRTAAALWPAVAAVAGRVERAGKGSRGFRGFRGVRVLDLACGGGDTLIALARYAANAAIEIEWVGADMSPVALDYARSRAKDAGVAIEFTRVDVFDDRLPGGFDLAMNSLFMHHLTAAQSVEVLRKMASAADAVLVNDLRRGALAYAATVAGTRVLSRSPVVHVDGPRSVRAAWTPEELRSLAAEAGLRGARVRRCFPWRMLLQWQRPPAPMESLESPGTAPASSAGAEHTMADQGDRA